MPNDMPPLDCATALQELWDYLDEELTVDRMQDIRTHLHKCSPCLSHAEFAEQFLDALRRSRDERLCPHETRLRVMMTLRSAGFRS
jgi:anti-sigma factor (TIGR02949 family)